MAPNHGPETAPHSMPDTNKIWYSLLTFVELRIMWNRNVKYFLKIRRLLQQKGEELEKA